MCVYLQTFEAALFWKKKKTDSKEVEGGSDEKLCFSVKERGKVWQEYMERIMDGENDWDHKVDGGAAEGTVVCVSREEVLQALNEMKNIWTFRNIIGVDCC